MIGFTVKDISQSGAIDATLSMVGRNASVLRRGQADGINEDGRSASTTCVPFSTIPTDVYTLRYWDGIYPQPVSHRAVSPWGRHGNNRRLASRCKDVSPKTLYKIEDVGPAGLLIAFADFNIPCSIASAES